MLSLLLLECYGMSYPSTCAMWAVSILSLLRNMLCWWYDVGIVLLCPYKFRLTIAKAVKRQVNCTINYNNHNQPASPASAKRTCIKQWRWCLRYTATGQNIRYSNDVKMCDVAKQWRDGNRGVELFIFARCTFPLGRTEIMHWFCTVRRQFFAYPPSPLVRVCASW